MCISFLGTYVVNSQTRNRVQKNFFIEEIGALKKDYTLFVKDIRTDKLSSEAIRDGFKNFSDRITTINDLLNSEYELTDNKVFSYHGVAQVQITGFQSIEEQYGEQHVVLSNEEKARLDNFYNDVNKSMLELIIILNRANNIKIWDREDLYNR